MFNKREEIDEIELGAELYFEGLDKSVRAIKNKHRDRNSPRA